MKQKIYHIIIFLLFWFCGVAYSQNPKADILQQDLSGLFDNLSMIGILGEDCSRIDIHITEVRKMDSREYEIKGISRTRLSVICPFKGKVCVDSISSCSQMIKSEYTELDGFIYGYYSFAEYGDKRYSGTFSGSFNAGGNKRTTHFCVVNALKEPEVTKEEENHESSEHDNHTT